MGYSAMTIGVYATMQALLQSVGTQLKGFTIKGVSDDYFTLSSVNAPTPSHPAR